MDFLFRQEGRIAPLPLWAADVFRALDHAGVWVHEGGRRLWAIPRIAAESFDQPWARKILF